jgi:hypothetical protein
MHFSVFYFVCVYVGERERECVCVCMYVCMYVCMHQIFVY